MGQCPVAPEGVVMIRLEREENLARRASNEGERVRGSFPEIWVDILVGGEGYLVVPSAYP